MNAPAGEKTDGQGLADLLPRAASPGLQPGSPAPEPGARLETFEPCNPFQKQSRNIIRGTPHDFHISPESACNRLGRLFRPSRLPSRQRASESVLGNVACNYLRPRYLQRLGGGNQGKSSTYDSPEGHQACSTVTTSAWACLIRSANSAEVIATVAIPPL